ncbi:MAG: hypothetical protein IJC18_05135 [Clostridia bacterium]|nr:hypothetical protein [Clostridia bacterium]
MSKKREPFIDDGRQIADMSVDGMPWSISQGRKKREEKADAPSLTREEERAMARGVLLATLLVTAVFVVAFTAFVLFCIFVWFK